MIRLLRKYMMPIVLVLIIPQVVTLLACSMFSARQVRDIPMAVYIGDNSALTREIVRAFDDSETFTIKYYVEDPNQIVQLIRENQAIFGLAIPPNFTKDMIQLKSPSLLTVVDGSQLSAASFARIGASEILLDLKMKVLEKKLRSDFGLTAEKARSAISALQFNSRLIGNPTRNYLNFLMPGMMTALAHAGIAMAAASSVNREKRRSLPTYLGGKVIAYTIIGFFSLMVILGIETQIFAVPVHSGWGPVVALTLPFAFSIAAIGVMISTIFWDKVFASQVAAVLFLPASILSGYTWPLMSMPHFYQHLGWFVPFTHYGDPLRDLLLRGDLDPLRGSIQYFLGTAVAAMAMALVCETFREKLSERRKQNSEAA